ncbi:tetratricopeptide repeat protein [Dactylosporangium sp. CA-052675]|uniref:tetratricopeptide repeat protein n=1 Tax=Dactylosporangium sp. CA-052675 TaxID=3239927 RepID=UPI003D9211A8
MRWTRQRITLVGVVAIIVVVVAVVLMSEGLDRADKWASVVGGGATVAGFLVAALHRRAAGGVGSDATFMGASLAAPAGAGAAHIRGRDADLRHLRRAARRPDGRVHVLTGLGGVGKSSLAMRTCRWFEQHRGRSAWWIAAEDRAGLTDALVSLAEELGAGRAQVTAIREGSARAVEQLWEVLRQSPRRWLLVFDNLDDQQVIAWLVESNVARCAGRGLVLVTSRIGRPEVWGGARTMVELTPLTVADAAQVLLDLAPGAGDRPAAQRLARDLGCLPLALHLAGANLGSPFPIWPTFDEYREAFHERGVQPVLAAPGVGGDPAEPRANVTLTWEMSLSALDGQGLAHCRTLLRVLSHFAPAVPVPQMLLHTEPVRALLGGDGTADRDALAVRRVVQNTLEGLAAHGLVDRLDRPAPDGARMFMLHPLVAEAGRIAAPERAAAAARAAVDLLVAAVAARRFDDNAEWRWFGLFAPHVEQLLRYSGVLGEQSLTKLVWMVVRVVAANTWRGQEAAAVALAGSALRQADHLGPDHPAILALRNERGWAIGRLGRWAEAHTELTQVCAARTRRLGPGHLDTLDTRHKLAWATGRLGDWESAQAQLEPVLRARAATLGDDHPDTLHTRCCLAWAIGRCGRPEEAQRRYAEIIAVRERVLGADHVETLDARHSLAELFVLCERFGDAERLLRPLIADRLRVLGADHPETLDTRPRYWLARALLEQGRRREARRLLRRLARDQQRHLGPEHAATEATLTLLGAPTS